MVPEEWQARHRARPSPAEAQARERQADAATLRQAREVLERRGKTVMTDLARAILGGMADGLDPPPGGGRGRHRAARSPG
jgi:hypothetical protein